MPERLGITMARERMITRTIESVSVEYLAMRISTRETVQDFIEVTGVQDDKKLLEAVKKEVETADFKVVAIVNSEKVERLFGMREQDFFNIAIELDPETRKPIYN